MGGLASGEVADREVIQMKKRFALVGLAIAIALVAAPAGGDTVKKTDGEDERNSLLDIKSVKHSHDGDKLMHKLTTYGAWDSTDLKIRAIHFIIKLSGDPDHNAERLILIYYKNGDMRAKLYNTFGDPPAFMDHINVSRPNNKSVKVKFKKSKLEAGDISRYKWSATTVDESSSGCNRGCYDHEPNNGMITHKNLM